MKRPSFNAVAVESARRDPDAMTLELNLIDAKGNSQNLVLSQQAVSHVLGAVFQKRLPDMRTDFRVDEALPLAGLYTFELPDGGTGLRLLLNRAEAFDVYFEGSVQTELRDSLSLIANRAQGRTQA